MGSAPLLTLTPADSARAVAEAYGVSLLLCVPVALALCGLLATRLTQPGAGTRAIVWRATIGAMVGLTVVRFLPLEWSAWIVPEVLAAPLVSLGIAEIGPAGARGLPEALGVIYLIGVAALLLRWAVAAAAFRVRLADRVECHDPRWRDAWRVARGQVRLSHEPRLMTSAGAVVPLTWGLVRPLVVLPTALTRLSQAERVAILTHELAHLANGDLWYAVAARILTVIYWFHPVAWFAEARFRASCEAAADELVLAHGTRPSLYAALLGLRMGPSPAVPAALGLLGSGGLRDRLVAIAASRQVALPSRSWERMGLIAATLVAGALGSVRVAPTRGALDAFLQNERWETRAWAVMHLAQRPDTVQVARAAAARDPNPQVRAWASQVLAGPRAGRNAATR